MHALPPCRTDSLSRPLQSHVLSLDRRIQLVVKRQMGVAFVKRSERKVTRGTIEDERGTFGLNYVDLASAPDVDRRTLLCCRKEKTAPSLKACGWGQAVGVMTETQPFQVQVISKWREWKTACLSVQRAGRFSSKGRLDRAIYGERNPRGLALSDCNPVRKATDLDRQAECEGLLSIT